MNKLYTTLIFLLYFLFSGSSYGQSCSSLVINNAVPSESRCMATGSITVTVSGGSGNYNYRVMGAVNTPYTSSPAITGLPPGIYTVVVSDISTGCVVEQAGVEVPGSYNDPRFAIRKSDETCLQASDGSIRVISLNGGRSPYTFTIVAPSPFGVGMTNNTGDFSGLPGGEYAVELKDSCGGIQTRRVTILSYNWWIDSYSGSKTTCDQANFDLRLRDSRGNTNTNGSQFNAYLYGVVNAPGDTAWYNRNSFQHRIGNRRSVDLVVKDPCGNVKTVRWTDNRLPSVANFVSTQFQACKSFTAGITGQVNLVNPEYCLYNGNNQLVSCNTTGQFSGLAEGAYSITIRDACFDTTIRRNFTIQPPVLSLAAAVNIERVNCNQVNAAVTGMVNFTNPQFCLYDAGGNQLACNSTGRFTGLGNGSYCIRAKDGCYDTAITRCFTITTPVPAVGESLDVRENCTDINIAATGQRNLTNPQYCLFDGNGVLVACNNTGQFNGLPYGSYCMEIRNDASCYDTTIRRCVTVTRNIPSLGSIQVNSRRCSGFDFLVSSQNNLTNPVFRLKNERGQLIATNTTGVFSNIPYGSYCVDMQNNTECYDTLITRCITQNIPVPAVGGVRVSGSTCTGFSANIVSVSNMADPEFRLLDKNNNVVAVNKTGFFSGIPFGEYCIAVVDTCYDTTITRCFTGSLAALSMNVTASPSCELNKSNLRIQVSSGYGPYLARVYDHTGMLIGTRSGSSPLRVYDLPALPPGQRYRVELRDNCGNTATRMVWPSVSTLSKTVNVTAKCPSGNYPTGSSELTVTVNSNLGNIYPVIIRKDAQPVSINYNTGSSGVFKWLDLEPASYVIEYDLPGSCNTKVFDTVVVGTYEYPQLNKSISFQCDNSSFSVGASMSGGAKPFVYEIIGSIPATPSVATPPQASPVFRINNGSSYSLIRLRGLDQCGNATLNDVSVLPLQNTMVYASSDCYYSNVVLQVDSIPNATYEWYFKTSASDSVLVSNSRVYEIPYLEPSQVGTYVSRASINGGCQVRLNYHNVTGTCNGGLLPGSLELKGRRKGRGHQLNWNHLGGIPVNSYAVERRGPSNPDWSEIGRVPAGNLPVGELVEFIDNQPSGGRNFYRIKGLSNGGQPVYSNSIQLSLADGFNVEVYPNPARDHFYLNVQSERGGRYRVELYTASGQLVYNSLAALQGAGQIRIIRNASMKPGLYLLKVQDTGTGTVIQEKLFFD